MHRICFFRVGFGAGRVRTFVFTKKFLEVVLTKNAHRVCVELTVPARITHLNCCNCSNIWKENALRTEFCSFMHIDFIVGPAKLKLGLTH